MLEITVHVNGQAIEVPTGSLATAALALAGVDASRQSVTGSARGPMCGMGIALKRLAMVNGRRLRTCQNCSRSARHGDSYR